MATIDKLELKIGIKNYRSTMRAVKKVTKALEKLNKASNECSESFKELKENIPMLFELGEAKKSCKLGGAKNDT